MELRSQKTSGEVLFYFLSFGKPVEGIPCIDEKTFLYKRPLEGVHSTEEFWHFFGL